MHIKCPTHDFLVARLFAVELEDPMHSASAGKNAPGRLETYARLFTEEVNVGMAGIDEEIAAWNGRKSFDRER